MLFHSELDQFIKSLHTFQTYIFACSRLLQEIIPQYQETSFTSLPVHHKIDVTKSLLALNQSNYVENIPISVSIFKHVFMLHFQYSHSSTSVCTRTNHSFSRAKLNNFVLNGSKASQIQTKNGKFQSKSLPSKQKKQILTNYHPQKSRESLVKISDFFDFRQKFV